jgi:hypothetical protein
MDSEFIRTLILIFDRDLTQVHREVESYTHEEVLWKICGEIKNPGGNLCLHICGNLQHFIGHVLGQSGYQRNRDYEFAARNIPRTALLTEVAATRKVVRDTLSALDPQQLLKPFPAPTPAGEVTTAFFLVHLAAHLNYHLGQLNYHRRLIEYGFF